MLVVGYCYDLYQVSLFLDRTEIVIPVDGG